MHVPSPRRGPEAEQGFSRPPCASHGPGPWARQPLSVGSVGKVALGSLVPWLTALTGWRKARQRCP